MVKLKLQNKYFITILLITLCSQIHRVIPNFVKSNTPSSIQILDRKGNMIRLTMSSDDKFRLWTKASSISPGFKEKILQKEDKYFYFHYGVNPFSLVKAGFNYVFYSSSPGASTISMQLARLFYKLKTKTISGKINQISHAIFLELCLSKEEIFESYLNLIPMGKNIEGINTASEYYLGKDSSKLNPIEIAFFSLLPQNPNRYYLLQNKRFTQIAKTLYPILPGFKKSDIDEFLKTFKLRQRRAFFAPHFSELVLGQLENKTKKSNTITTSLDLKIQIQIEETLKDYIDSAKGKGLKNATSLIVNSHSGEIISYVGSKDFFDASIHGQVDGILAKRSPGSTLKPFIYALSFDQGLYIPQSIVYDSPLAFRTPENYDRTFKGPMTIEEALITSRNIPAVDVNSKLRSPSLYETLQMAGIKIDHKVGHYGSSIALGALELSSFELAKLYVLLAENGKINNITPFVNKGAVDGTYLISPEASILVKDILKKHKRPNFQNASQFSSREGEVYWKTGTSFGFRDAWAAGIWGKYVIITWVGDFKSTSNPFLVGSITAGPLFFKIIDFLRSKKLYSLKDDVKHNYSRKVTEVKVCTISGKAPNKHCPHIKTSLYIPHVSPIEKCKIHREIEISTESGLRVCSKFSGKRYKKVFEFFNTEKIQLYEKFGLKLSLPPKFEKICSDEVQDNLIGLKPEIISPKIGFTYLIEKKQKFSLVPLIAKTDSDVTHLSWYINGELVKKNKPGLQEQLNLKAGVYRLKVIDDKGRIDTRMLTIENTL